MAALDALLFTAADQTYALPLLQVQEIRGRSPTTPLPEADAHCLGVINLRGSVLPVFDARLLLGKPAPEPRPNDVIIVVTQADRPAGLLVDGVSDIAGIDEAALDRSTASTSGGGVVAAVATMGERLVPLLDLARLLPADEVPQLAA